jgi:hypothetical protein
VALGVDLSAAGDALRRRGDFLLAARGASGLLAELGCVRFVGGPDAASSRGRRRRGQDVARAENLRNAAASLSLPGLDWGAGAAWRRPTPDRPRSWSWSLSAASSSSSFESAGPINPVRLRRAITSEEEADRYRELSARAAPAEGRLAIALGRFPLPDQVFAAAGGDRDNVRDDVHDDCDTRRPAAVAVVVAPVDGVVIPGFGIVVAEGGTPPPLPPPPPGPSARDNDRATPPRDALHRIIPREWLEEGSSGGGGCVILPDSSMSSSSSSSSSLSSSSSSSSLMDLSLWGAQGSTTSNMIFDMILLQIVMG